MNKVQSVNIDGIPGMHVLTENETEEVSGGIIPFLVCAIVFCILANKAY